MKEEDRRNRLLKVLAIVLSILVVIALVLLFKPYTIYPEIPYEKDEPSIIDIPGIGERSDPLEKDEAEVDIKVTPQYHGSFSWDKIGEWLEDPSELIDNTSLSIEGKISF